MGVLSGYKIIELSGIGPGPLCGMLFADLGAEVIRVDRKNTVMPNQQPKFDITGTVSYTHLTLPTNDVV